MLKYQIFGIIKYYNFLLCTKAMVVDSMVDKIVDGSS